MNILMEQIERLIREEERAKGIVRPTVPWKTRLWGGLKGLAWAVYYLCCFLFWVWVLTHLPDRSDIPMDYPSPLW